jgi:RHS repeat-associated protein
MIKRYQFITEHISSCISGGKHDAMMLDVFTGYHLSEHYHYKWIATDLLKILNLKITCYEMNPSKASFEHTLQFLEKSIHQSEPNWYIYHSDHLGSSSFLTDASGDPTQHLQYMPFGETFVEQRSTTSYYTPYTFSAKERDLETGYSYFGVRYYSSDISVWLSVDPFADKYPSMSAYMYCAGNPVMLVDPDGREIDPTELYRKNDKGEYVYKQQIAAFEEFIQSKEGKLELSKYAKKGQTIAGVTFEKDGEYHLSNIDIAFVGSKGLILLDNRDGQTSADVKNSRLLIQISVAGQSNIASGLVTTIYEVFIHGSQYSRDYKDNKKLDNSHAYPALKEYAKKHGKSTRYIHHFQELNSDRHMEKYGLPIMRKYYRKIGKERSDDQIRKEMEFIP